METVTTHRTSGPPASPHDEPILEEQFDDLEQQHEASSVGMWVFLATEVMFFGGLIAAYAVYRATSPREVRAGQPAPQRRAGLPQHRDPAGQQPHDGSGCSSRATPTPPESALVSWRSQRP